MTSFKSEAVRIIDKFNGGKFKIKKLMPSMDLWNIVNVFATPPSPKVLKEYHIHVKKAMSIIGLYLAHNQLVHIKRSKGPAEAWKILCNCPCESLLIS